MNFTCCLRATGIVITLATAFNVMAADFPNKPITLIVPYSAGGGVDGVARAVSKGLSDSLKQPVIVDNAPGAEGLIGAQRAARAQADGYTLVIGVPVMLMYKHTHKSSDPMEGLIPISLLATGPSALVVSANSKIESVSDLAKYCKVKKCAAGSGDQFSGLAGKDLLAKLGILDAIHVPYKGGGPMITDLAGSQIDIGFASLAASLPLHKAGKLKILATGTNKRFSLTPDIPSYREAGVENAPFSEFWYGLFAPKNTPETTLATIRSALLKVAKDQDAIRVLDSVGSVGIFSRPEEFQTVLTRDQTVLADLLRRFPTDR